MQPPLDVAGLLYQGKELGHLGRHAEALAVFDSLLARDPDNLGALNSRGVALMMLGRENLSLESFKRAIEINPEYLDGLNNYGNMLIRARRYEEALASFDRALNISPGFFEAHNNRGTALEKLMNYRAALESYDRALEIRPDYVEALDNKGVAFLKLGNIDKALECADEAQKIRPDFVEAHLHEGLARLLTGDFKIGLRKYEWRHLAHDAKNARKKFSQPLWIGKGELRGKTILLHAEQGLGDSIHFSRYAPLVAAKGATVFLDVPKVLTLLMNSLNGVSRVLTPGEPLPQTDFHCPLLSLPLAFNTDLATIPTNVPYLFPSPRKVDEWKGRIPHRKKIRVGLAWSGHSRSIELEQFTPLFSVPNVEFVSLQKNIPIHDVESIRRLEVVDVGVDLQNFADTAAVVSLLDLVISVDTSIAHLAGALGKPVWIFLTFSPDWRWLLKREDSPWYPTARLFRQSRFDDWGDVIQHARRMLLELSSRQYAKF